MRAPLIKGKGKLSKGKLTPLKFKGKGTPSKTKLKAKPASLKKGGEKRGREVERTQPTKKRKPVEEEDEEEEDDEDGGDLPFDEEEYYDDDDENLDALDGLTPKDLEALGNLAEGMDGEDEDSDDEALRKALDEVEGGEEDEEEDEGDELELPGGEEGEEGEEMWDEEGEEGEEDMWAGAEDLDNLDDDEDDNYDLLPSAVLSQLQNTSRIPKQKENVTIAKKQGAPKPKVKKFGVIEVRTPDSVLYPGKRRSKSEKDTKKGNPPPPGSKSVPASRAPTGRLGPARVFSRNMKR